MDVVFHCQVCRARLNLTGGFDGHPDKCGAPGTLNQSVLDSSKIDESFIVLDDKRPPMPNRGLEESFVVLGSASLLRQGPTTPQNSAGAAGLDAKLQALAQLFELASTQTRVDHPLCLDCATQLKDEVDSQIQETEREIAAYSAAVGRLEKQPLHALSQSQFDDEMEHARREEEAERQNASNVEEELSLVQQQLEELKGVSLEVDALEERYWHEFNDFHMRLKFHIEERDSLLNKIDRASQRLQLLKSTNVYNDAFKIGHDGSFGTISGFRLGRTPEVHVEWDEINAAWGQAVLLLHTMAQACKLNFAGYRLLPMGSHPRIAHKASTYDLFGPVNKLWSANYDRAMVCYLACLREFGDFARARDVAAARNPFEFPFPIEGDKVGNQTIKLTLNKDARWTKALKFLLANLKVLLKWMVKHELLDRPALPNLGPEGPSASSS